MDVLKWLSFQEDVKKTPAIVRSVELLDPYFEGEPSIVTSGLRSVQDQMGLIIQKAKRHRLENEFKEFQEHLQDPPERALFVDGMPQAIFWWQRTWSKLLSIGDIVNPPIAAACLFDYFRPESQENKKGQIIGVSPHSRGLAFDIGGGSNLPEKSKRVRKAKQEGNCFIKDFLVEYVNNACHVDTVQIG